MYSNFRKFLISTGDLDKNGHSFQLRSTVLLFQFYVNLLAQETNFLAVSFSENPKAESITFIERATVQALPTCAQASSFIVQKESKLLEWLRYRFVPLQVKVKNE